MATATRPGDRPLAVVTGASTGIGFELASIAAEHGFDLLIVADEETIESAAERLSGTASRVTAVTADLTTSDAVDKLLQAAGGRPIDVLFANAGRGLGRDFIDQDVNAWRRIVDTNITGTLYLIQKVARGMRERGRGRILITGSIAGLMPGTYQAVYNGTKAFLDSFAEALHYELKDNGVVVTCLLPGATETEFFKRADMLDTKVGTEKKQDAREVAQTGYDALMSGEEKVVAGWRNKVQAFMTNVLPDGTLAKMHVKQAAPGTAQH
ncbi:MAG TPA: SDR family NAD(P)-dependent oxidoreductase [Steroidobacteraceae bacterium]